MALAHGAANQRSGAPVRSSRSPSTVSLATGTEMFVQANIAAIGGSILDQSALSVTPPAYQFFIHLNAIGQFGVKVGAGLLIAVVINTKGTSGNTLSLYDTGGTGTSNPIAVIDTTTNIGTIIYNCNVAHGVNTISASGTAADVTLIVQ